MSSRRVSRVIILKPICIMVKLATDLHKLSGELTITLGIRIYRVRGGNLSKRIKEIIASISIRRMSIGIYMKITRLHVQFASYPLGWTEFGDHDMVDYLASSVSLSIPVLVMCAHFYGEKAA